MEDNSNKALIQKYPLISQYRKNKQNEIPASPGSTLFQNQEVVENLTMIENDSGDDDNNDTNQIDYLHPDRRAGQRKRRQLPDEGLQGQQSKMRNISHVNTDGQDYGSSNPNMDFIGGKQIDRRSSSPMQHQSQILSQTNVQNELIKYKKDLLAILSKFGGAHTQKQASNELKRLMKVDITDNDKMIIFLNSLGNLNEHMNVSQMKEQIKQFGVAAEIFDEALVPFLPRIMISLAKRIKEEGTNRLHTTISETIGQLTWNILDKIEDEDQQLEIFDLQFLRVPLSLLEKQGSKVVQCGAISCLTKIIINCSDSILFNRLDEITDKLVQIFKIKQFGAQQQLLECLISIIFHIQDEFKNYYQKFLPIFVDLIQRTKDANTKRVAIDAVYSIGAHLSMEILEYKDELILVLDKCRTDKNQPVRAAAQETLKLLKELECQNQRSFEDSDFDENLQNQELISEQEKTQLRKVKNKESAINKSTINDSYPSFADQPEERSSAPTERNERSNTLVNTSSLSNLKQIKPYDRCKSPNFISKGTPQGSELQSSQSTKQFQTNNEGNKKSQGGLTKASSKQSLGKNDPANRKSPDMKRTRMDSGAPKAPKQKLDTSYSDNEVPNRKLPPKSGSNFKKRAKASAMKSNSKINVQNVDMTTQDIERAQELLLHDQNYLKDKSVKKVSLATLKRRKVQIEAKQKLTEEPPSPAKSRTRPQSLAQMKEMYKGNKTGGFGSQAINEMDVALPVKREHKSVFSQQLNNNFSKVVDDNIIVEAPKPDLEQQQALEELQHNAQQQYLKEQEEFNKKYEGLTPFQRKKQILQDLKKEQAGGGGGGAQAAQVATTEGVPATNGFKREQAANKKNTSKSKKQSMSKKKNEWNFDTEILVQQKAEVQEFGAGIEEDQPDKKIQWLSSEPAARPYEVQEPKIAWASSVGEEDEKIEKFGNSYPANDDEILPSSTNEMAEGTWAQRYKQQLENSNTKKSNQNSYMSKYKRNQKNQEDDYEFQDNSHQISFNQPNKQQEQTDSNLVFQNQIQMQLNQFQETQQHMIDQFSKFTIYIETMNQKVSELESNVVQIKNDQTQIQQDVVQLSQLTLNQISQQQQSASQANQASIGGYNTTNQFSTQTQNLGVNSQYDSQLGGGQSNQYNTILRQIQQQQQLAVQAQQQKQQRDQLQNLDILSILQSQQNSQGQNSLNQSQLTSHFDQHDYNKQNNDKLLENLLLKNKMQQQQQVSQNQSLGQSQSLQSALLEISQQQNNSQQQPQQTSGAEFQSYMQQQSLQQQQQQPKPQENMALANLLNQLGGARQNNNQEQQNQQLLQNLIQQNNNQLPAPIATQNQFNDIGGDAQNQISKLLQTPTRKDQNQSFQQDIDQTSVNRGQEQTLEQLLMGANMNMSISQNETLNDNNK